MEKNSPLKNKISLMEVDSYEKINNYTSKLKSDYHQSKSNRKQKSIQSPDKSISNGNNVVGVKENKNKIDYTKSISPKEANRLRIKIFLKRLKYLYKKIDEGSHLLWNHDNSTGIKRLRSAMTSDDLKCNWKNRDTTQIGYGEITAGSFLNLLNLFQNVSSLLDSNKGLNFSHEKCASFNMDSDSFFLDIGSGFGKPNFHAAFQVGCYSKGIEVVPARAEFCVDFYYEYFQAKNFFETFDEVIVKQMSNEYSPEIIKAIIDEDCKFKFDEDNKYGIFNNAKNGLFNNKFNKNNNESNIISNDSNNNMNIIKEAELNNAVCVIDKEKQSNNNISNDNSDNVLNEIVGNTKKSKSLSKNSKNSNKSTKSSISQIEKDYQIEDHKLKAEKLNLSYVFNEEVKLLNTSSILCIMNDINDTIQEVNNNLLNNKENLKQIVDFKINESNKNKAKKTNKKDNKNTNKINSTDYSFLSRNEYSNYNSSTYSLSFNTKNKNLISLILNLNIINDNIFNKNIYSSNKANINSFYNSSFPAFADINFGVNNILYNNISHSAYNYNGNGYTKRRSSQRHNNKDKKNLKRCISTSLNNTGFLSTLNNLVLSNSHYNSVINKEHSISNFTSPPHNEFKSVLIETNCIKFNNIFCTTHFNIQISETIPYFESIFVKILNVIIHSSKEEQDILYEIEGYNSVNLSKKHLFDVIPFINNIPLLNFITDFSNSTFFLSKSPEYIDFKNTKSLNYFSTSKNSTIYKNKKNKFLINNSLNYNKNSNSIINNKQLYEELMEKEKYISDNLDQQKFKECIHTVVAYQKKNWAEKIEFVSEDATKVPAYYYEDRDPYSKNILFKKHFTHIYAYNKLMSKECRKKISKVLNNTDFKVLAWYSNPLQTKNSGLKNCHFLCKFPMQSTSTEKFSVYVYIKDKDTVEEVYENLNEERYDSDMNEN